MILENKFSHHCFFFLRVYFLPSAKNGIAHFPRVAFASLRLTAGFRPCVESHWRCHFILNRYLSQFRQKVSNDFVKKFSHHCFFFLRVIFAGRLVLCRPPLSRRSRICRMPPVACGLWWWLIGRYACGMRAVFSWEIVGNCGRF